MKLVRDKIPAIIEKSGRDCKYHLAAKSKKINWECSEYGFRLLDKLHEEADEFEEEPSVEEAADIYEVFVAMLDHWNLKLADVKKAAKQKAKSNGKFEKGIVLEKVLQED